MPTEYLAHISSALNNKASPTHCPGCTRRILSANTVGSLCRWIDTSLVPEPGGNSFYLVCVNCLSKLQKPAFLQRCERRISREPSKYTINPLPDKVSKLLGKGAITRTAILGKDYRDQWVASDRDWFSSHPARSYRLRLFYAGELAQIQQTFQNPAAIRESRAVVVVQIETGIRYRLPIRGFLSDECISRYSRSDSMILKLLSVQQLSHITPQ